MQQLDSLWREQGLGGPICFSWIDWLQNDALPFLGITERLLLTFTPRDPAPGQSSHVGPAGKTPALPSPSQRMQLDVRTLAHDKAAVDMKQDEHQASQQLAGPANASRAGSAYLQSRQTNGASHQALDRQYRQHQHFQGSGSISKEQAPQRGQEGRQTAHDCAAERSCNGQLGTSKHRSSSQQIHGTALNPNAHAWQPQSCPQSESGGLQAEQGHERAAVPAGKRLMQSLQPEQPVSAAGTAKLGRSARASGMADASQAQAASSPLGELEKPVSDTSTLGERLEHVSLGSRAAKSEECLDPSCDMEQVAKLFTRLAAYSKMRDRELFKEVRQYHCMYGPA